MEKRQEISVLLIDRNSNDLVLIAKSLEALDCPDMRIVPIESIDNAIAYLSSPGAMKPDLIVLTPVAIRGREKDLKVLLEHFNLRDIVIHVLSGFGSLRENSKELYPVIEEESSLKLNSGLLRLKEILVEIWIRKFEK